MLYNILSLLKFNNHRTSKNIIIFLCKQIDSASSIEQVTHWCKKNGWHTIKNQGFPPVGFPQVSSGECGTYLKESFLMI